MKIEIVKKDGTREMLQGVKFISITPSRLSILFISGGLTFIALDNVQNWFCEV